MLAEQIEAEAHKIANQRNHEAVTEAFNIPLETCAYCGCYGHDKNDCPGILRVPTEIRKIGGFYRIVYPIICPNVYDEWDKGDPWEDYPCPHCECDKCGHFHYPPEGHPAWDQPSCCVPAKIREFLCKQKKS